MGVAHRWYAAAPSNFGAAGMTDATLIKQTKAIGSYWTTQSNGAISSIVTPTAIAHYTSTATTAAGGCGLTGTDFWPVVQEAAAQFPDAHFDGTDQLIVMMPATCVTGSVSGRGTQGALNFGGGGYSISITNPRWFQPTLAHEIGHNYGYGHSRLGPCEPACANEYGDYYSVMGAVNSGYLTPTALSTPFRVMQGITDAGEVETLTVNSGTTTTYTKTLRPRSDTSGLRALALPADIGQTLYVEYRSGTGADKSAFYAKGASSSYRKGVVVEAAYASSGTALVPDSSRKALVLGESRTFTSDTGSVTVSVTKLGAKATVKVAVTGNVKFPKLGTVALSVLPTVGRPITAELRNWSPAPTTMQYQWYADGVAIADASDATWIPTADQLGAALSVTAVVAAPGYLPTAVSTTSAIVKPGAFTASGKPTISGTASVGSSLYCSPPPLTNPFGTPVSTTRWVSNGALIAGATRPDLVIAAGQLGTYLTCEVTISSPGFTPLVTTSAPAKVAAGRLRTGEVGLSGEATVGSTLTATTGTWTTGTTFSYQWLASGKPISGATAATLAVTGSLRGKTLTVMVTGQLTGYTSSSVTSAPSATVS